MMRHFRALKHLRAASVAVQRSARLGDFRATARRGSRAALEPCSALPTL